MRAAVALASVLCLALAGCLAASPAGADEPSVAFLAIGDAGTGETAQYDVAAAMAEVCRMQGCDFVVDLGDLIYPRGVADPYDPQFEAKFEEPFARLDVPFYNVLGNHDVSHDPAGVDGGLGSWYDSGKHMVAYAAREDRASAKWTMPARYYVVDAGLGDGPGQGPWHAAHLGNGTLPGAPLVRILALDTTTFITYGLGAGPSLETEVREQEAALQQWRDSPATWTFAMGHHPYLSNGLHGDAGRYDGTRAPGLSGDHFAAFFAAELCDIDLYLAGHDHDLQWLAPAPCGPTEYIVSGAAASPRSLQDEHNEAYFQQGETLGFWHLRVGASSFTATAYDQGAQPLYSRTKEAPTPGA